MKAVRMTSVLTTELVRVDAADEDVVKAARVSVMGACGDEEMSGTGTPAGLIKFLMKNRHGTPFEHNSFTFRIHAPIFVLREFQRHRVGWSYNEESGRYREMEPVFYVPDTKRNLVQVGKAGAYTFEPGTAEQYTIMYEKVWECNREAYYQYGALLRAGIAKEVARMVLPLNLMSSMYATCNARSLMHFLSLRTTDERSAYPSFPQREIEMVAEQMEEKFRNAMPQTWNAFTTFGRVSP